MLKRLKSLFTKPGSVHARAAFAGDGAAARIILDDRERASGLHEAIARTCGVMPGIQRLDVGDILVARRYLIERKSSGDFCASISDGRLFRQLGQLVRQPYEAMMIIEGEFAGASTVRLHPEAIRGAMISIALDWRMPVLWTKDVDETAAMVVQLSGRRAGRGSRLSPRQGRMIDPALPQKRALPPDAERRRQAMEILESLPGVGRERAESLLRHFGTPGAVFMAGERELAEVEGIGRNLAARIRSVLHEDGKMK